jgi:hypothetical protein
VRFAPDGDDLPMVEALHVVSACAMQKFRLVRRPYECLASHLLTVPRTTRVLTLVAPLH